MLNEKYFELFPTTHFIEGDFNNCLYNTLTGDIIELSEFQLNIIKKNRVSKMVNESNYEFYKQLDLNMYGEFTEQINGIENTYWGDTDFFIKLNINKILFSTLHINITNDCNFNCVFCDSFSNNVFRHTGCKKWNISEQKRLEEKINYSKYIYESKHLGCNSIRIFGGEPLILWNDVLEIIKFSNKNGINDVNIYTNGMYINREMLDLFIEYDVSLTIQIVKFKNNKELLGIENDFDYLELLNILKNNGIKFNVIFIVSKYNENELDEYISILKGMDIKFNLDILSSIPQNVHYSDRYSKIFSKYNNKLKKSNLSNFGYLKYNHPCYSKIIAISYDGNIYPCIMSRFVSYGQLDNKNAIADILRNNYDYKELKILTKSKKKKCGRCSYRYACVDCSAINTKSVDNLYDYVNCNVE
ncbi:MAG: radical SAM protein [Filifactoraceae bacterium]